MESGECLKGNLLPLESAKSPKVKTSDSKCFTVNYLVLKSS